MSAKPARNEDFLQMIIKTVTNGIFTIDGDGEILSFNPAAERIFGYKPEEAIGRNMAVLVPKPVGMEHDHFIRAHLKKSGSKPNGRVRELTGRHKNGRAVPLELSIVEVANNDVPGRPDETGRTFACIVSDITETKRTIDAFLSEKRRADAANLAKTAFLSNISHELRTPLTAIIGYGEILESSLKDTAEGSQKEYLAHILNAANLMSQLICDLSDLASIESGKLDLAPHNQSVREILEQCLSMTRSIADGRRIEIVNLSSVKKSDTVWADGKRCKQVLLNLLTNAIKYNHADGRVYLDSRKTPDGYYRINVTDTGYGIPEDMRSAIFEPFNRLGWEKSGIEGSGLGLAITKKLVEAMGGRIGFESEPGRGTTFWIELSTKDRTLSGRFSKGMANPHKNGIPELSFDPHMGFHWAVGTTKPQQTF